jgi:putative hydrolase of the HAD superfamily
MTAKIRNLIFDLGGVLLDLDFDAPFRHFRKLNRNESFGDPKILLHDPVFIGFETGAVSPEDFRSRLRHLLNNPNATNVELDHAWCSMLKEVPSEKVALLQELSADFRLFLYSNTNAIHIPWFSQRFTEQHGMEWPSLFERTFYSHEINDRKPLLSGYRKVIGLAAINPEETLFVDDLLVNIQAAEESGLKVLHYTPGSDLRVEVRRALRLI